MSCECHVRAAPAATCAAYCAVRKCCHGVLHRGRCPRADTEIDWVAYMQEVDGWAKDGHTDYLELRGGTGPLVYPAGFLYVYRALQLLVGDGGYSVAAVRCAQWAFLALYLATLAVVMRIYERARCVRLLDDGVDCTLRTPSRRAAAAARSRVAP